MRLTNLVSDTHDPDRFDAMESVRISCVDSKHVDMEDVGTTVVPEEGPEFFECVVLDNKGEKVRWRVFLSRVK